VLNAYTSHDLVAFHITCRAEVIGEAIDLLTDFVGRPRIDAEELDRERGVVIQEIARANDQPSVVAEHLIDRAAFGDHPLGRPVLGPEAHLRTFSREAIVAFRSRQWAGARGGAFLVGNLSDLPDDQDLAEAFGRFPSISPDGTSEPAPAQDPRTLVEPRESNQSHLRISYRPAIDVRDPAARAALGVYSTLLGGSMGSRLFDEIREQRGLAYSVYSSPASAWRPTRGCARSSTSCARTARARTSSSAPGRTPRGAVCSRSRTRTPSPGMPPTRRSCSARTSIRTPRSRRWTR